MKHIRSSRGGLSATTIALGLLAVVMTHLWRPGAVIMQGDSVYFPDPFVQLRTSFLAWNHVSALAGSYSQTVCYTLLLLISGVIQKIAGYSFSQIVVLWLLIGGAWVGAFRLARRFEVSKFAAFISAWLYAVNPWAQQFYAYNYQLQVLIVCLPFIVLWMMDAAAGGRYAVRTFVCRFALFAALPASVFGINPALLALTIFVLVPFIPFAMMHARRVRPLLTACLWALPVAIIAAGWWLIPTAWADLHSAVTAQLSPNAWSWVTAHSSFLDNFRFEPTWWWKPSYVPYCDVIDKNILLYGSQFTAVLLLIFGLCTERNAQRRTIFIYSGLWTVFALFVSKGYHEPFAALNEAFFTLPGAFFFREPTTKAPLLALAMLILPVAFSVDLIGRAVKRQTIAAAQPLSKLLLVVAMLAAGYPTISGIVFHDVTDEVPGLYARVPDEWRAMAATLNADAHGGGVLMLPFEDFYQVNYGWFYGADSIADWLLTRPVVHLGDAGYAYTESPVQQSLERQLARAIIARDPHITDLCRSLGIRYILFRGDVTVAPELRVTLDDIQAVIGTKPVRRFGQLAVVALDNDTSFASIHREYRLNEAHDAGFLSMLAASDGMARVWPANETRGNAPRLLERTKAADARVVENVPASAVAATDATIRAKLHGSRMTWHVSRNEESPKFIAVTHDVFSANSLPMGFPIPAILEQSYSESGRHRTFRIFNPSSNDVRMNLRLTVHSDGRTRYVAKVRGVEHAVTVDAQSNVDWVAFNNVVVPAGQTTLSVDWQRSTAPPSQRAVADVGGTFLGVLQFEPLAVGRPPAVVYSRNMHLLTENEHRLSGTVAIERSLQDAPNVYLGIGFGSFISFTGVVFDVERDHRRYLIYAHSYASNIPLETRKIVQLAFERAHLPLRRSDFPNIIVHAVGLDGAFLNGPNDGDPGIAAVTMYDKLLDRNAQPADVRKSVPGISHAVSGRTRRLVGTPAFTLTGLNLADPTTALAEIFSLHQATVRTSLRLHVPRGETIERQISVAPGYSYIRIPVSAGIADAVHKETTVATFLGPLPATLSLVAAISPYGVIRKNTPGAFVNYTSVAKPLAQVPALWLLADIAHSTPDVYWGALWDVTWRGRRFLVYQHEYIQGLTLNAIPNIVRTLSQNAGGAKIRENDVFVNGVAAAATVERGKSGIARIADFDTTAVFQNGVSPAETWTFELPEPVVGAGNVELTLCAKDNGPLGFAFLNAHGAVVQRHYVMPGVFSELSDARPKVGTAYAVSSAIHSVRVTVPSHIAEPGAHTSPCVPDMRIATQTQFPTPIVSVGEQRYKLHGASGEFTVPDYGAAHSSDRIFTINPGSAKTAFAAIAPSRALPPVHQDRLALQEWPLGTYRVTLNDAAKNAVVSIPDGFDALWIAIGFGGATAPHILGHAKINGWANGFAVGSESSMFVFNLMNMLQLIATICSLIVTAIAISQLRSFTGRSKQQ